MQEPPFPPDTRAKGWRLEIDHERIDQSDTWALAKPEVRPWLLMLWLVAWKQTPCGSLPAEDELVVARIGMSPSVFARYRGVLMRGWWAASDGRLYHNVLVQRVQEMLAKRMKDAERAAKSRANKAASQGSSAGVTRDATVSHEAPTREFDTKHQEPEVKAPPVPPAGGKKRTSRAQGKTFRNWLAEMKAKPEKPIPEGDSVFAYCDSIGLPQEFLTYHWREFKVQYAESDKRYSDWRRVLRVSVRRNWFRLWFADREGNMMLTTAGEQARRAFEAEHREAA